MPRIKRIEIIDYPYHVIQRGNRNQKVFIYEGDKEKYLDILKMQSKLCGIEVWAYCLMDNHVHLIVAPKVKGSLINCIGQTHWLYSRMINFRENWKGHLWQGRFKSYPMDEKYLWTAVRYVERNPVRVGLVNKAEEYPWSSASAHVNNYDDDLLSRFYLMDEIKDWGLYLSEYEDQEDLKFLRSHQVTGRPLGGDVFVSDLQIKEGRLLFKRKPGPKKLN